MHRKKIIAIWIISLFFFIAVPAHSGILDGKTFVGKNGQIGKNDSEDDEIRFKNGKFLSVGCAKYGFGDAEYTSKKEGDRVFFTADIYSDKYGRITYSGSVKGNDLEATFVCFDKGKYEKPEQVKWWKGHIKK
jgi:hypothetical protein